MSGGKNLLKDYGKCCRRYIYILIFWKYWRVGDSLEQLRYKLGCEGVGLGGVFFRLNAECKETKIVKIGGRRQLSVIRFMWGLG